jgi:GrpB-like predicted nucleotidyltransferase (UPF0157 family)
MPSLYTFSEYSPDWPLEFEREASRLRSYLHDVIVTIHHIGSTSVPGLAGKPVIDLMPVVTSIQRVDELTPLMEKEGYRAWGEYGLPGRRFFTRDRNNFRTHNIHIYPEGHLDIIRHLAFCAYLRHHGAERRDYEAVKRAAYIHHPANIQGYMDEKDGFIKRIETIAIDWYKTNQSGI